MRDSQAELQRIAEFWRNLGRTLSTRKSVLLLATEREVERKGGKVAGNNGRFWGPLGLAELGRLYTFSNFNINFNYLI